MRALLRLKPRSLVRLRLLALPGIALALAAGTSATQDAVANGDTRTLSIIHTHTKESLTVTFKRDGRYDRAALDQLNWLLRDWRADEPTKMDPRLFDTVWEAYRQVGSSEPVHVVSAYRSPGTNAMLRRRSRAVAEFSQHMLGKAMDFYLPDVGIDRIREVGFLMQRGGVGWYPRAGNPFIHLDVGSVRSWPRMGHDQLARLFPDGKTVHLSSSGPMTRYEEAKAEIIARGGTVAGINSGIAAADEDEGFSLKGFFAGLFGGGSAEPPAPAPAARGRTRGETRVAARAEKPAPVVAMASADPEDAVGTRVALAYAAPAADDTLRGTALRGAGTDARSLITAATPASRPGEAKPEAGPTVEAPLPPRRPAEFAAVAAALAMPLPPPLPPRRPTQLAVLGPVLPVTETAGGMAVTPPRAAEPVVAGAGLVGPDPAVPVLAAPVLVAADAEPAAQVRALFEAMPASAAARPAGPAVPVRLAAARPRPESLPVALVAALPDAVATRFTRRSPGDDLAAARFTGSASRGVPGRI